MIDLNHPAVIRCFPDGNVDGRIVMAEMFAEIIREALPHLTADDLRHTPAGRALMAEAWQEGAMAHAESTGHLTPVARHIINETMRAANPYREETPNE